MPKWQLLSEKPRIIDGLVWVGALLMLITLLQLFWYSDFKIARELSLVDIATALLTLFLAIYIPTRLERRLSSKRFELEVLIRGVERLQAELGIIRNQAVSARGPLNSEQTAIIIQGFTNVSHGINTLIELSKLCKRPDLVTNLKDLEVRRRNFKRLLTGGGFQRNPNFTYSPAKLADIDSKYYANDLELSKLIISVNRLL